MVEDNTARDAQQVAQMEADVGREHIGRVYAEALLSMGQLSRQYDDRAKIALATLLVLAGFAVWCLVAALVIALIFRIALFYIGTLNDALKF